MEKHPAQATTSSGDDDDDDFGDYASTIDGGGELDLEKEKREESEALAHGETKAVGRLRFVVFAVLILSMASVSIAVFYAAKNAENVQFEQQFDEDANKVLQSLGTAFDLMMGGIDSLVVSVASTARATNQTWPYVTIPDFGSRAEKIRGLTSVVLINLYNYVPTREDRYAGWQPYSAKHGHEWVEDILNFQIRENMYQEQIDELNATINDVYYWDVIHGYDEYYAEEPGKVGIDPNSKYKISECASTLLVVEPISQSRTDNHIFYKKTDPGPFLPMWQTYPLLPSYPPYNWYVNILIYS